jgi:hypothetical protein
MAQVQENKYRMFPINMNFCTAKLFGFILSGTVSLQAFLALVHVL